MKLVLCEGDDDKAVIERLCAAHSIDGIKVEHYKGRDNLGPYVRDFLNRTDYRPGQIESIGIVQDADQDGRAARERVAGAVKVLEEAAKRKGLRLKVASFIVTRSGEDGGMIEDLCLAAVSQEAGYPCLEAYFDCMIGKTGKQTYHPKAKWRAWMACQSDYDLRTGLSAEKGYVPVANPAFDSLRDFLRSL